MNRLYQFNRLRTNTEQICLVGDSRTIDIASEVQRANPRLADLIGDKKIKGIFSSPPYVGLIDYHEQHAYAMTCLASPEMMTLRLVHSTRGKVEKQKKAT
jgi:hypothetical protein